MQTATVQQKSVMCLFPVAACVMVVNRVTLIDCNDCAEYYLYI